MQYRIVTTQHLDTDTVFQVYRTSLHDLLSEHEVSWKKCQGIMTEN